MAACAHTTCDGHASISLSLQLNPITVCTVGLNPDRMFLKVKPAHVVSPLWLSMVMFKITC